MHSTALLLLVSCSGFAIDSRVLRPCSSIITVVSSKAADLTAGPLVAPRALGTTMMAAKYLTVESLEIAIREHIATTYPEGSLDDESLPSPLNYKELSFHGRDDLVEGCMAFGGYLQLSQALGLPVRIGVVRAESDEPLGQGRGRGARHEGIQPLQHVWTQWMNTLRMNTGST